MEAGEGVDNPLLSDSPLAWDKLIQAVGPASLLLVVDARMGPAMKRRYTAEDVLQEALLHAWRDRSRFQWRGLRSFRSWLLTIIDNRIRDLATYETALKRGGGNPAVPFSALRRDGDTSSRGSVPPIAVTSTTPSRIASYREQAGAIRAALELLPEESREVVRLRLMEQLTMEEIADRLGLGVSAVRHRFRKGAQRYRRSLMSELASRSQAMSEDFTRIAVEESSPK